MCIGRETSHSEEHEGSKRHAIAPRKARGFWTTSTDFNCIRDEVMSSRDLRPRSRASVPITGYRPLPLRPSSHRLGSHRLASACCHPRLRPVRRPPHPFPFSARRMRRSLHCCPPLIDFPIRLQRSSAAARGGRRLRWSHGASFLAAGDNGLEQHAILMVLGGSAPSELAAGGAAESCCVPRSTAPTTMTVAGRQSTSCIMHERIMV